MGAAQSGIPGVTNQGLKLLAALHRLGGSVVDPSGRATGIVAAEAGVNSYSSAGTLGDLESLGYVLRDARAKRTYEIVLGDLPDKVRVGMARFASAPRSPDPEPAPEVQPEPEVVPEQVAGPGHNGSSPGAVVAQEVTTAPGAALVAELADELLRAVLARVDAPEAADDRRRLADVLEECDRLRAKVAARGDAIRALSNERDGLRTQVKNRDARIATLEGNLSRAIKDGARIVDGEVQERLARFMSARPEPGILSRSGG